MEDRKLLRQTWAKMEQEKTRLLRAMTLEQSTKDYLLLCQEGEAHLLATEQLFRADREKYLIDLQEKLRKFGGWWQEQYGNTTKSKPL